MTGHGWRHCEVCSETKHWYLLSSLRNVWWTLPLHRTGQVLMWSIENQRSGWIAFMFVSCRTSRNCTVAFSR